MERTKTEYFCDQCGKQIENEHSKKTRIGFLYDSPQHIRIGTGWVSIQKPDSLRPMPIDEDEPENLDFCSFQCLNDYIRTRWTEYWLDQINEDREKIGLEKMKIGLYGHLERIKEPEPA